MTEISTSPEARLTPLPKVELTGRYETRKEGVNRIDDFIKDKEAQGINRGKTFRDAAREFLGKATELTPDEEQAILQVVGNVLKDDQLGHNEKNPFVFSSELTGAMNERLEMGINQFSEDDISSRGRLVESARALKEWLARDSGLKGPAVSTAISAVSTIEKHWNPYGWTDRDIAVWGDIKKRRDERITQLRAGAKQKAAVAKAPQTKK